MKIRQQPFKALASDSEGNTQRADLHSHLSGRVSAGSAENELDTFHSHPPRDLSADVIDPDEGPESLLRDLPNRRRFLSLMSASLALAGLSSCRKPVEKILPYVKGVEETIPGIPVFYATSMPLGISSAGLLVSTFDGRPTKIEGLPGHPSSMGASDIFMQAAILNLYDQDRSRTVICSGVPAAWSDFVKSWQEQITVLQSRQGEGFALLTEQTASPTFLRLRKELISRFPKMKCVAYEPVSDETALAAAKIACGAEAFPVMRFESAQVILSLDSDALDSESGHLRHARGFASGRYVTEHAAAMNRLYVVEPSLTVTGGAADHRLRLEAGRIYPWSLAFAAELGRRGLSPFDNFTAPKIIAPEEQRWISAVADDLLTHRGSSLITAGRRQPVELHLLVFALNVALGNIGTTLDFVALEESVSSSVEEMRSLTAEMNSGKITHLAILGGNPVYNAPVDFNFSLALEKVPFSAHLSDRMDETSARVTWHLPATHFLEEWGDCRSTDGQLSVIQPMIEPLFGGRSVIELLYLLHSGQEQRGYELVRESWKNRLSGVNFDKVWRRVLHDGLHYSTTSMTIKPDLQMMKVHIDAVSVPDSSSPELELSFKPSSLYDGRWANNAWLQELPDPVTKVVWDNPARISAKLARERGLNNGDIVHLRLDGRELTLPVWIIPGQADFSITLDLGYGRSHAGRVGNEVGFNTYLLRSSRGMGYAAGAAIESAGKHYSIACAQEYDNQAGRPLVREASLERYRKHPQFAREAVAHPPLENLWKEHEYSAGYQWGMVIDLNVCIGCNACTIACQSENNIPVVGKKQVALGREMHWIRLDRYFSGHLDNPQVAYQPVACQHCENAPCEQVCPVAATVHDHEGLNVMAYNRCVGTRYCSNNCPYKARRFNFFDYTKKMDDLKKMAQNPDVTVRMRGVMEKCTYCLQRLTLAKSNAKLEGRVLADGEVMTACQQACPTGAITFGNLLDAGSKVKQSKESARSYELLGELNIRPRTSFAAKLRNPNPALS